MDVFIIRLLQFAEITLAHLCVFFIGRRTSYKLNTGSSLGLILMWYQAFVRFLRKLGSIRSLHEQQKNSVKLFANYLDTFETPQLKSAIRDALTTHSPAVQDLIRTKRISDFNAYINTLDVGQKKDKVLNFQVELINIVDDLNGKDAEWFWSSIAEVYRSVLVVNAAQST